MIDERVFSIDVNLMITVVAAILLVGGIAVLVAKRKGKKR